MKEPVLVIMAAGMGSRYGGLKQIDPVDKEGHLIIDFSIYDGIKAGFKNIVFIITHEMEADFRELIGDRISKKVNVKYVYQELAHLPKGYAIPEGRVKPWGTGHAILSCMNGVNSPFAVINADDFYGEDAFHSIYDFLISSREDNKYRYTMVSYIIENTLTEHGSVARGVCDVTEDGFLKEIHERTRIEQYNGRARYTEDEGKSWVMIPEGSKVSMNMWGFHPSILKELEQRFLHFLKEEVPKNPLKAEYFLPSVVGELLEEEKATVKVLSSKDKWYGVTYREDKVIVENAIKDLKKQGCYPNEF